MMTYLALLHGFSTLPDSHKKSPLAANDFISTLAYTFQSARAHLTDRAIYKPVWSKSLNLKVCHSNEVKMLIEHVWLYSCIFNVS